MVRGVPFRGVAWKNVTKTLRGAVLCNPAWARTHWFISNIKSKQRLNPENLHYLLLLPKRIGELQFGRVVGKGGDVLVSLRTAFLFGVPCCAACDTKCVCLCVYVCVCVCVCLSAHLPNEGGP